MERVKLSNSESERSRKIYLAEIDWYQGFEKVLHSRESFAELVFCLIFEISGLSAAFVEGRSIFGGPAGGSAL